jgi:hypothetical protein
MPSPTVVRDLDGKDECALVVLRVTRWFALGDRPSTRQRTMPATSAWSAP